MQRCGGVSGPAWPKGERGLEVIAWGEVLNEPVKEEPVCKRTPYDSPDVEGPLVALWGSLPKSDKLGVESSPLCQGGRLPGPSG